MKNTFDESAKWYSDFYLSRDISNSAEEILRVLQPTIGKTIFDLGCGTGDVTNSVMRRGFETIGIDPSKNMIGLAESTFSSQSLKWIVGDLNSVQDNTIEFGYSYFHVANYIAFQNGIAVFVESLSKKMKVNSKFAFDYWRKEQVLHNGLESRRKTFEIQGIEHVRKVTPKINSVDHIEIKIEVSPKNGKTGVRTSEIHQLAVFDESEIREIANQNGLIAKFTNWDQKVNRELCWDSVCVLEKKS
jgi:ubiquinone/menaquinone biosynthesis C-methylase UbiE